jgi:hypothetical protein
MVGWKLKERTKEGKPVAFNELEPKTLPILLLATPETLLRFNRPWNQIAHAGNYKLRR